MNVEIKRNLIIFKKLLEWEEIRSQVEQDFGKSIFLISWRSKRELGFTVRHHVGLHPINEDEKNKVLTGRFYYQEEVHLDFYTESALSWFCLKYFNRNYEELQSY